MYGKVNYNVASKDEKNLLRCMTPLLKLFTAKEGMNTYSEILEYFGGQGKTLTLLLLLLLLFKKIFKWI